MRTFKTLAVLAHLENATAKKTSKSKPATLRYTACNQGDFNQNITNGFVQCAGSRCIHQGCDDYYQRLNTDDEQEMKATCLYTDDYQAKWSNPLTQCSTCIDPLPLRENLNFDYQCNLIQKGAYWIKKCGYYCANGGSIMPFRRKYVPAICSCEKEDVYDQCHWRSKEIRIDDDDEYHFSKWWCTEPHNAHDSSEVHYYHHVERAHIPTNRAMKCDLSPAEYFTHHKYDQPLSRGASFSSAMWPYVIEIEHDLGYENDPCTGVLLDTNTVLTTERCCDGPMKKFEYYSALTQTYNWKKISGYSINEDGECMIKTATAFERIWSRRERGSIETPGYACLPRLETAHKELPVDAECYFVYHKRHQHTLTPEWTKMKITNGKNCGLPSTKSSICAQAISGNYPECENDEQPDGPLICLIAHQPVLMGYHRGECPYQKITNGNVQEYHAFDGLSEKLPWLYNNVAFPPQLDHVRETQCRRKPVGTGSFWQQRSIQGNEIHLNAKNRERIIGGQDLELDETWPWIVNLRHGKPTGDTFCGGTILDEYTIVTAAHCFRRIQEGKYIKENIWVTVGDHNQATANDPNESTFYIEPDNILLHAGYSVGEDMRDDIAILKTTDPLPISQQVDYACLPSTTTDLDMDKCWVAGWGLSNKDEESIQETLKEMQLSQITDKTCKNYWINSWAGKYFDSEKMFCAYSKVGDACKGDDGGPVMCLIDNQPVLAGIMSFGLSHCGEKEIGSVFTRITNYLDWITSRMEMH